MIFLEKKLKSDWIKQGGIFSILTFFTFFQRDRVWKWLAGGAKLILMSSPLNPGIYKKTVLLLNWNKNPWIFSFIFLDSFFFNCSELGILDRIPSSLQLNIDLKSEF